MDEDIDVEQRTRLRAYELWSRDGRPDGRSDYYWERAQADLAAEGESSADPPSALNVVQSQGAGRTAPTGMEPSVVHPDLPNDLRPAQRSRDRSIRTAPRAKLKGGLAPASLPDRDASDPSAAAQPVDG
ncbi:MAG TPA: DUF2934 domain-containing protein [Caulobacteraceae bacterium]|nr:DUF2934 domain-containing protein [Caulobacteraceae bacterium]